MSQTSLAKPNEERAVEFTPFGAADKIRLTVKLVQNFIAVPTKSGRTCSDRDATKFVMLCQAQRLNPFAGDAFLTGYDGKNGPVFSLIVAHCAFLKRAEVSADYEGMESGIILQNEDGTTTEREGDFKASGENVVGGWARVHRKGRKPMYRRLSVAAMKPNYETPFWSGEKIPGQIVKCAEADALRATFPTLLGNLYMEGEMFRETVNVSSTVATSSLVAIAPPPAESESSAEPPAPEREPDAATPKEVSADSPQMKLGALVEGEGFKFDDFIKWATESGNIPNADSLPSWAEVETAVAKRLLNAKAGLLKGLQTAKAGAQ
jgi:phage recombination protein Bet